MTKRLVALLLSLIMLLGCLVGCGKKEDEIEDIANEGSERTITLSMYLMSEEKVSDEQALAIQNAVNKITKSKFKTQLILHYFSEAEADKYYKALENAYDAWEAADAQKDDKEVLTGDAATETADETYVDEYGVVQLKYPTIPDYQVDIFYLSGYDTLFNYIDEDMVADIGDQVENSSKILKSYIPAGYLNSVDQVCEGLYALPTNAPIGEYTYMLLNKEILAPLGHTAADFSDLFCDNAQSLLDYVKTYEQDYVPFLSFTGEDELDIPNVKYIGVNENGEFDSKKFSLAGQICAADELPSTQYVLGDGSDLAKQMRILSDYEGKGYYRKATADDKDTKFAMGYVKGGLEVIEQYKDEYEIVVLEKPELNTIDLFNNMFAISPSSADVSRSMEILTYLYTNKDFNNLLLYGIEGENYKIVESDELDKKGVPYKQVERLNQKYVMSPEKLGNMLISYPTVDQPYNLFDLYNEQNIDSHVSSLMGMVHDYDYLEPVYLTVTDADGEEEEIEASEFLRIESEKWLKKYLDEANSAEAFDEYLAAAKDRYNNKDKKYDNNLKDSMAQGGVGPAGEECYTITGVFNYWVSKTTGATE